MVSTVVSIVNGEVNVDARFTIEEVNCRKQWEELTGRAAFPHLPQSFDYGSAKLSTGWNVRRYLFRDGERIVAFGQFNELRRFGIKIVTRINRGPIFVAPETKADRIAVYAAIRAHWGVLRGGLLLIAPGLLEGEDTGTMLRQLGFHRRPASGWGSGRIDLTLHEDAIWQKLSSGFRNRYRSAEKAGAALRILEDEVAAEWLIERHCENMREKRFDGVPGEFIRALHRSPAETLIFQVVHEEQPVAGMSVVRFGSCCEYHIGWFGDNGRKFNAGNFLMWQIICEMKRRGCEQLDVGGMLSDGGFARFKRTLRPDEYQLAGEWAVV